jgi:hypothetical protein
MAVFSGPNLRQNDTTNVNGLVTDQLQLFYDAARSFSYTGSGATWKDLSGNGRDLTLYNAGGATYSTQPAGPPTFDANASKGIFTFDGTNDWGKFGAFTFSSNVSVTAWVKTTNSAGGIRGIISHCSGGPVYLVYGKSGNKMSYYYYTTSWQDIQGTSAIDDGNWKNLVWTKSGTNLVMYINGIQDFTTTLALNRSGSMNCIGSAWGPCNSDDYGAGTDGYSQVWPGSIAMVMVHSKQLSATEVSQNYNNTKRRYGL